MSIHFEYEVDIDKAISNINKVEKKVAESVDVISKVGQEVKYDTIAKPFKEAQGIVGQLKEAIRDTSSVTKKEFEVLQSQLLQASDKLREFQFDNNGAIDKLQQGLTNAQVGRYNAKTSGEAQKYSTQIAEYQKFIAVHKELQNEGNKLGTELDNLQQEFNKLGASIDKQTAKEQKMGKTHISVQQQIRKLKAELNAMKASGDTTSEAYKKVVDELIRLKDIRQGTNAEVTNLASINGVVSGFSALSGVATTTAGALSLFGSESQALQGITSKLNALMGITIGLQQVEQQLLEPSAFRQNILNKLKEKYNSIIAESTSKDKENNDVKDEVINKAQEGIDKTQEGINAKKQESTANNLNTQSEQQNTTAKETNTIATGTNSTSTSANTTTTTANTTATNINTTAKNVGAKASLKFAAAIKTIGFAIKSIPVLGWVTLAISGVVALVSKISSSVKKQKEEQLKAYKEVEERNNEFARSVAKTVAPTLITYQQLRNEYKQLKSTAKGKWIKDHANDFKNLGYAVSSVSDADKVFVKNSQGVINSLMARAKATAITNRMVQNEEDILEYSLASSDKSKMKLYNAVNSWQTKTGVSTSDAVNYITRNAKSYGVDDDYDKNLMIVYEMADKVHKYNVALKDNSQLNKELAKVNDDLAKAQKDVGVSTDTTTKAVKEQSVDIEKAKETYYSLLASFNKTFRDTNTKAIKDDLTRAIEQEENRYTDAVQKVKDDFKKLQEQGKVAGVSVDEQTQQNYNKQLELLEQEHNDKIASLRKEAQEKERKELDDLLQSYQDYDAKRLSIEKKYNEDLLKLQNERAKAETDGRTDDVSRINGAINTNRQEYTKQVLDLDLSKLKETPEYVRAFEDLKNTSTETIQFLIGEFDRLKNTVGATLDPTDMQEFISTLEQMQDELDSRDLFASIITAREELKNADKELKEAEEKLNEVLANGGKGTQEEVDAVKQVTKAKDKQIKANNKLKRNEKTLLETIKDTTDGFQELGDTIGGEFGEVVSAIGSIGTTVLSAVISLKTMQAEAYSTAVAMKTLETASVILAGISTAFTVISTLYNTFFNKEDDSYERAKSSMKGYIEVLDKVIDKQKELMDTYSGEIGDKAFEQAKELIEKQEKAYRDMMNEYLNSGADWNSKSKGKEMSDKIKDDFDGMKELLDELNKDLQDGEEKYTIELFRGRMNGLSELSASQLETIKMSGVWAYLDDEVKEYINNLIDLNDTYNDLVAQNEERYTLMSKSDWISQWRDELTDLDVTAEDVFNNITEYIRQSMIKNMAFSGLQDKLNQLYDDYSAMWSDGTISDEELQDLKTRINELSMEGKASIDTINEMFSELTDTTRTASSNAFGSMSQESATKLEGMFTAVQGHTYDIRDYTLELKDCALMIQKDVSGINVNTASMVSLLNGVNGQVNTLNSKVNTIDTRLKGFEMQGINIK